MTDTQVQWIKKELPWSAYPIGTKAGALIGGYWEKTERGWKWFCGSTFPTPGGDFNGLISLPNQTKSK